MPTKSNATRLVALVVTVTLISGIAPARADTNVGRWCDALAPGLNMEMTIVRRDDGTFALQRRYSGGSSDTTRLVLRDGWYWLVGSELGERLRVTVERFASPTQMQPRPAYRAQRRRQRERAPDKAA